MHVNVWLLFILIAVEMYHSDGNQCYGELLYSLRVLLNTFKQGSTYTANVHALMILHNHDCGRT